MARIIDPEDFDKAVDLYLSGEPTKEAAASVGIGATTLRRELHRRGIEPRQKRGSTFTPEVIAEAYTAGESVLSIASRLGINRQTVDRKLKLAGVNKRTSADVTRQWMSQRSPSDRKAMTRAANKAARGRTHTLAERVKRANTRESRPPAPSAGERIYASWLEERGVRYTREKAVGPYNVDFACGPIAVEILGGEWHRYKAIHRKRVPHILDAGWSLLFAWATPRHPLTSATADYLVTFMQETRGDPASGREYRVIRGDGHLIASGGAENDDFTHILPARA